MQEGKWCAKVDLWWCWRTNSILIASDRGFKPNPGPIRPFIIHLVPSRVASSTWASRLGFSRATTMVCMTRQSWKSWKLPESSKALELQVWSHSVNCGTWMDRHDISLFWDPSAKGKMGMEFLKNTANVDLTMYIYIYNICINIYYVYIYIYIYVYIYIMYIYIYIMYIYIMYIILVQYYIITLCSACRFDQKDFDMRPAADVLTSCLKGSFSHSFSNDSNARPRPVFLVPHAACEAYRGRGKCIFRLRPVWYLRIEIYRDLDSVD